MQIYVDADTCSKVIKENCSVRRSGGSAVGWVEYSDPIIDIMPPTDKQGTTPCAPL